MYIGNPVPETLVSEGKVHDVNIADNIAQHTMIKGFYEYYGDGLTVVSVSPERGISELDLGDGVMAQTIHQNSLHVVTYYSSIMINYTKKLNEILGARHDNQETIIISNGPYIYRALPALIMRWRYGVRWVPFLIGAIEVPEVGFPYNVISKLSRWTSKRADGAITYVAKSATDYMPGKPFIEIAYLIDEKSMKVYREFKPKKPQKFTIAYTGALTDVYNIDVIIDVIKKTHKKYRWVFAGRGQNSDKIKQLAANKEYDVDYLGSISNTEAIKLQKSSHLLLCLRGDGRSKVSQYYSKYAASGKLTEYLCSGTPILAGDIMAFSDAIKPFMTCEKNQTTDQIIRDLVEIEENYTDKVELAQKGQRYAFDYFTAEYQNKRIYNFLEEL